MGISRTAGLFCVLLALAVGLAPSPLTPIARADEVNDRILAACAVQGGGGAYSFTHTGFGDIAYTFENTFPGREAGDVMVEFWVTASATFRCTRTGAAPFDITMPDRLRVYGGDVEICEKGLVTLFTPGAACPTTGAQAFPGSSNFASAGAFPTAIIEEGPDCTIFRPAILGQNGLRHPVVIWGNGTGATPTAYTTWLSHFASHGFVVAAANTTNAGSGREMLACLDWLEDQAAIPTSPYYRTLNLNRVATAGHSQGATGAILAGADPRIGATAPIEPGGPVFTVPYSQMQHGPMLLLSGSLDSVVPPLTQQKPVFDATTTPVFWGTVIGGLHVPPPTQHRTAATAWFRYWLAMDDNAWSQFFGPDCAICASSAWQVQKKGL